jgi:hypothetical protein
LATASAIARCKKDSDSPFTTRIIVPRRPGAGLAAALRGTRQGDRSGPRLKPAQAGDPEIMPELLLGFARFDGSCRHSRGSLDGAEKNHAGESHRRLQQTGGLHYNHSFRAVHSQPPQFRALAMRRPSNARSASDDRRVIFRWL